MYLKIWHAFFSLSKPKYQEILIILKKKNVYFFISNIMVFPFWLYVTQFCNKIFSPGNSKDNLENKIIAEISC